MSTNGLLDKEDLYTYTMEDYSALRKKILPFLPIWMELEGISQRKKEKYYMTSLIYGI